MQNSTSGLSDNELFKEVGMDPSEARSIAESFGIPFSQDDVDEDALNRENGKEI